MRKNWNFSLSLLPGLVYLYLVFLGRSGTFSDLYKRCWLFAGCVIVSTLILSWSKPRMSHLVFSALVLAIFHRLLLFVPDISTSPWSLNWSEASRYYYASLFFSQNIYGIDATTSILHPGRYLLQAFPFLFSYSPVWIHRLWQVLLWLMTTFGVGWLMARRLRDINVLKDSLPALAYMGWSFLFLMQGPVYYHLLIIVIVILWGVKPTSFSRTLGIVLATSAWAGLTRLNWYSMPGLLAVALYFLEVPFCLQQQVDSTKNLSAHMSRLAKYIFPAMLWLLLGTFTALISQWIYLLVSGNSMEYFGSPFTSSLLWYRLWPNPTNPIGVIPSIVVVSMPLGIIICTSLWNWKSNDQHIRMFGLAAILSVLIIGGLIVSVKIGGGSNLHNMDAYLVMLWLVGTYQYYGVMNPIGVAQRPWHIVKMQVWPALLIPITITILLGGMWPQRDTAIERTELQTLRQALVNAKGEILFISQRQLLTFGEIDNLSLSPQHEALFLMEMAMANNQVYLEKFHAELAVSRYSYIVSDTLNVVYKGRDYPFGEENDIWVAQVSEPILCYYEPVLTLRSVNVQLLAPRVKNCRAR